MNMDQSTMFDELGRVRRWVRRPPSIQSVDTQKCCDRRKGEPTKMQIDYHFVEQLEIFEQQLFDNI